jgi:tetratricopeptide (TPR) repeat protein
MKSNRQATKKPSKAAAAGSVAAKSAWAHSLVPLFVGLVTCAVFLPSLSNDFLNWDDDTTLANNPHYRGLGWQQLRWMFTTFLMGHYQPLSWISFGVDYLIWGMDPFGYHLTNLILHTAGSVIFYFVSRRLLALAFSTSEAEDTWRLNASAALAALLFAVHPLRVESVAWATERRDVLSGVFYFSAIYCYLRAAVIAEGGTRKWWLWATAAAYLLSLLSKATAMTLPAILILLDLYPLKRLRGGPRQWFKPEFRGVLFEKIPFLLLALACAAAALFAQHTTGALKPLDQFDLISRLLQASFALMFYMFKTVWPLNLSPIYELPVDAGPWFWLFILSGVGTITLTLALAFFARSWPAALACWAYYVIVLAPVTGVAQSGPQLVADRYTYLACLSWPLLLAGGFFQLQGRSTDQSGRRAFVATALAAAVILIAGVMTWNQNAIWRTPKTLWQYAVNVAPASSIAHYNLARTLEREHAPDLAIDSYRRAVTVNPSHAKAHLNLAALLAGKGFEAEAIEHYRQALEIRPDHADAHNNLGLLLENRGDLEAAASQYEAAIRLDPNHDKALYNRAGLFAKKGDLAQATATYENAARANPNASEIQIGLAINLARQGRLEAATTHFLRATELKPDHAEAHVLLARALAAQGKKTEAERHYREALRLLQAQGKTTGGVGAF